MSGQRVCLVTTFYPPFNFGGDGIAVQRLARGLAKHGCEVTVVHDADAHAALTPGRVPPPPDPPDPLGVRVVTLRTRWPRFSGLLTHQLGRPVVNAARLRRLLDDGRFDVVVFNNVSLVGGPGLLSYGGQAVKLYLAHEHWLVCPTHVLWRHQREPCDDRECVRCQLRYRRPPQLWRHTPWLERQLAHVDVFIALSEFSRAKHREFGFPRDMEVVPNFLPDPDPTAPPSDARRPHERPYFLVTGRLERFKGLDEVIDLFTTNDVADLLVIGEGTHEAALRARAAGNPRVRFIGRLPPEALEPYYRHAVAVLAPSLSYETFGLSLIEAFSQRTPVIARRLGSFPEIVNKSGGGLLFDTTAEMLQAMRALISAPETRDAMGQRGFSAYVKYWSEGAVLPGFLRLVDRARAKRQPESR
jgi:glycosyltransferase involved in cell wall biosynthesis